MIGEYRGKRLFAGRLFAGRLFGATSETGAGKGRDVGGEYFRPWEDFPLIHTEKPAEKVARKLRVVAERQAKTGVEKSERLAQAASVIGEINPKYASAWLEYYRAAYTKALDAALRRELAIQRAIMDAQDDEALALLLLEC